MSDESAHPRRDREVLASVLGPGAPELSCEECFAELDRYVELVVAAESADAGVPGMRAHLEGCPACAEDFESLLELVSSQE